MDIYYIIWKVLKAGILGTQEFSLDTPIIHHCEIPVFSQQTYAKSIQNSSAMTEISASQQY
jgi:hypothetical protein